MKKYLILLTLIVLAACTKEASDDLRPADGRYSMTVKASKVGTKALGLTGSTLNATWAEGEKVYVHNDTKNADLEGFLTAQGSGTSTTLRGELTGTIAAGDHLTLKFCNPSYASQTGTLGYIQSHCDYATATVTVNSIAGGDVTINGSSATFINQQAIVKFTLLDNADGTTPVNATELKVSDGTNTYTVTPASATNVLFVAIPGFSNKTVTLTAIADGVRYNYEKTGVTFENNKYYDITVKMTNTGVPVGAVSYQFTVNADGGKVYFSQGNLQYQASTDTWRFAEKQYDAIGSDNSNVSPSFSGWIDSFGWGSGNQPTQTSEDPNVYSSFVDWGTHAISNGGNTANLWRTLSESEWTYLVFTRSNASSKRGRATVNGMYCFVLLPDEWELPTGLSFTPDANNWTNIYTTEQWAQMEAAGAVCLPASGSRAGGANNTNVNNFNEWCCYWSSTSANSTQGYNLWVTSDHVGTTDKGNYQMGASVRLVKNMISSGSIGYATTAVNKTTADAAFTNPLTLVGDGTVTYVRSDGDDICTVNAATGEVTLNGTAGTCTITATVADSPFYTYATATASYTLSVAAATLSVTASNYSGTYDGAAHGITVTCDGATIKYRTTASGEYNLTENPTYSAAGTYTVYYQVTRAYYTTVTGSRTVTISQKPLTITAKAQTVNYGTAITKNTTQVTTNSLCSGHSLTAITLTQSTTNATTNGTITPSAATIKDGSNNVVTSNYNITYSTGKLTINKVAPTYTAPTARTGLTYTGSAQTLINAGSASGGTMYYSLDNSNWYTSVDNANMKRTDANTSGYTAYYKVTGDGNHNNVASASIKVAIAKANGYCTLSSTSSDGWLLPKSKNETITVTHHGGNLTYSKSGYNTDNISVSFSGNNVTISKIDKYALCYGTVTITSAATNNYHAASATYTCNGN